MTIVVSVRDAVHTSNRVRPTDSFLNTSELIG